MEYADRCGASMIAVGSSGKTPGQAAFIGSVGRGLVISARQSVLIAKGEVAPTGPVRAVFATDHSGYANRCLQLLKHMTPCGLSHLTVVTCYEKGYLEPVRELLPGYIEDPDAWITRGLEACNRKALQELEPLGCSLEARVIDARANAGIGRVMQETGADLLIVGAHGHGFVERLTVGSASLHQAVVEPYSVLVLRIPLGGMEAEA
jgi:nucleotide-binding universal stress UspA family protein